MLNGRHCQNIVDTASDIIGYSILITGNDGIVMASSEKERIGVLHEASLDVISSGCQLFHNEKQAMVFKGTRPGTTIPIVINGEVIGTIGITGKPQEISKYGILIKKLAEVFLKDQLEIESARYLDQSRQNLLRELITYDPNTMDEKAVLNHGLILGYELLLPRCAVLIEIFHTANAQKEDTRRNHLSPTTLNGDTFHVGNIATIKQFFGHRQDLCVCLGDNKYIIFTYLGKDPEQIDDMKWVQLLKDKCSKLLSAFRNSGSAIWIGIGSKACTLLDLRDSYNDAHQAIYIAKRRVKPDVQYINDVYLEKLILSIPKHFCKHLFEEIVDPLTQLKDGNDLINMIIRLCENKFNFAQTARDLNVHKNTLSYRFNKLRDITGFDGNDFNSMIALYIVITYYKLNNLL